MKPRKSTAINSVQPNSKSNTFVYASLLKGKLYSRVNVYNLCKFA